MVEINASWCWPFNRKDMRVYGLETNLTVVRILDAARTSAKKGKAVKVGKGL